MEIGNVVPAKKINGDTIVFETTKDELERNDTYRIFRQLHELCKAKAAGKNALVLVFRDYDDDPRERYRIPEMRTFYESLIGAFPELFYFLNIESYTFAMAANSLFRTTKEVDLAESAMLRFAHNIGDTGRVVTVRYYATHRDEFHGK